MDQAAAGSKTADQAAVAAAMDGTDLSALFASNDVCGVDSEEEAQLHQYLSVFFSTMASHGYDHLECLTSAFGPALRTCLDSETARVEEALDRGDDIGP